MVIATWDMLIIGGYRQVESGENVGLSEGGLTLRVAAGQASSQPPYMVTASQLAPTPFFDPRRIELSSDPDGDVPSLREGLFVVGHGLRSIVSAGGKSASFHDGGLESLSRALACGGNHCYRHLPPSELKMIGGRNR
jgi:hypothetical protein